VLKCWTNSRSTTSRWPGPVIRIWSRPSAQCPDEPFRVRMPSRMQRVCTAGRRRFPGGGSRKRERRGRPGPGSTPIRGRRPTGRGRAVGRRRPDLGEHPGGLAAARARGRVGGRPSVMTARKAGGWRGRCWTRPLRGSRVVAIAGRAPSLGILGPQDFDTWAEFCGRLPLCLPAPTSADTGLTSHFGVARPVTPVTGLRRSGWRRSVDHDRGSLRELGQNRFDHSHDLRHAPRRSEAKPHWCADLEDSPGGSRRHAVIGA